MASRPVTQEGSPPIMGADEHTHLATTREEVQEGARSRLTVHRVRLATMPHDVRPWLCPERDQPGFWHEVEGRNREISSRWAAVKEAKLLTGKDFNISRRLSGGSDTTGLVISAAVSNPRQPVGSN